MTLYKTILSFVLTLPFSLLVASSDQENTLQESGLNTTSHKIDNRPIAPKPAHPPAYPMVYPTFQSLTTVGIYQITEAYQRIYAQSEDHPQKEILRVFAYNAFKIRAVQEVTWINEN